MFLTPNYVEFYKGGYRTINYYNEQITKRREKYPFEINDEYNQYVKQVNDKGYCRVENFFDKDLLLQLKKEFDEARSKNQNVRSVQENNHVQMIEPFLNSPTAHKIAFDDRLIQIATGFFDCVPGIGTFNLRRSEANGNRVCGTNMFHRDFNSPVKILKFFFYLNDVTEENGPFTYVEGSNREMPLHWDSYHRWPDHEIENVYGKNRIKFVTANVGDLLIGATNGFHKGLKLKNGDRTMFTINYLIHPEMEGSRPETARPRFHIWQDDFENLPDHKKPVADFLIKKQRVSASVTQCIVL